MWRHTVIIGGGPAGLAAAVCLAERGIGFVVLERGPAPLDNLRRIDPEMTLLSPRRQGRLPHTPRGLMTDAGAPQYLPFRRFIERVERYRRHHGISVHCDVHVTRVERMASGTPGFRVHARTAHGERVYCARAVINATGIISEPRLPDEFDPERCSFTWTHSVDLRARDIAHAASGLLVVGGGISATGALAMWLELPADQRPVPAMVALRSPMFAVPHTILGLDISYLTWLPERLPATFPLLRRYFSKIPAIGLGVKRAMNRGVIEQVATPARYREDHVELVDGRVIRPELVVFATGFRYRASHLDGLLARDDDGAPVLRACQSTVVPDLYLLGVPFGRGLASSFLRGIVRDADHVARRIADSAPG